MFPAVWPGLLDSVSSPYLRVENPPVCVNVRVVKVSIHEVPGTYLLDLFLSIYPVDTSGTSPNILGKEEFSSSCSTMFSSSRSTGFPIPFTILVLKNTQLWILSNSFTQTFTKPIFIFQHYPVVLISTDRQCPVKFCLLGNVILWCLSDSHHHMGFVKYSFPLSLNAFGSHLALLRFLFYFS